MTMFCNEIFKVYFLHKRVYYDDGRECRLVEI